METREILLIGLLILGFTGIFLLELYITKRQKAIKRIIKREKQKLTRENPLKYGYHMEQITTIRHITLKFRAKRGKDAGEIYKLVTRIIK